MSKLQNGSGSDPQNPILVRTVRGTNSDYLIYVAAPVVRFLQTSQLVLQNTHAFDVLKLDSESGQPSMRIRQGASRPPNPLIVHTERKIDVQTAA